MLGALIGGAAGLLGGIFQNNAAKSAANKQMRFQKETLQHQYQWGMEDMRKAGLNPMLAYKQGGAGSASGSSYTPQNVGTAAVQGASTGQSSALQTKMNNEQLRNISADTKLKNSQEDTAVALALQHRMLAGQAAQQTAKLAQETETAAYNTATAKAQAAQAEIDTIFYKSEIGKRLRLWEKGIKAGTGGLNLGLGIGKGLGSAKGSPGTGRKGPVTSNSSTFKKNSKKGYNQ